MLHGLGSSQMLTHLRWTWGRVTSRASRHVGVLVHNVRWLCRETCELCWQLRTGEESWDPDALRRSTVVC